MSTTVPRRRVYDGDVPNPQDQNNTTTPFYGSVTQLNEQNLSSDWGSQVEAADLAADVAYRIAHYSRNLVQEVVQGLQSTTSGVDDFADIEQWITVWTLSWVSDERAEIYAQANLQVGTEVDRAAAFTGGLAQFNLKDAMNVKVCWELDGLLPSEHVLGAMDLGGAGLNMERGISGEYNNAPVSALFTATPPGQHTLKLRVLRSMLPDEVNIEARKVYVSTIEALVLEISR